MSPLPIPERSTLYDQPEPVQLPKVNRRTRTPPEKPGQPHLQPNKMKERKPKGKLAASPNWAVRCISVPGPDTDLTLHVSFDSERYIFGCGEGTQRAFAQKARQLKGIQAVLLPNAQARTRAGLPGMIMTLADAGLGKLNIIGTSDTAHYLATMRSCLIRDKFPVHAISYPVDADPNEPIILHETPSLTISGISLSPEASRTANEATAGPSSRSSGLPTSYETPDIRPDMRTTRPSLLSSDELSHWRNMVARGILGKPFGRPVAAPIPSDPIPAHDPSQPAPPATGEPFHHFDGYFHPSWPEQRFPLPLPSPAEQEADMVYFFQAPEVRGKLNVQKADTAGVPRLQRGDLTRGEAVEVDDPSAEGGKRVVRPEECLEGGGPGPALIVVSCSAANVDGLLASRAFHRYQPARSGAGVREGVSPHVVVHRVEHAVWADERYQAWMRAFGSDTQHLFADPTRPTESIYFRNSAWNATQLSILDTDIFHMQQPDLGPSAPLPSLPSDLNAAHLTPYTEVRMHPRGPAVELQPTVPKDEALPIDPAEARTLSLVPILKPGSEKKDLARGIADKEAFDAAVEKARSAIAAEAVKRQEEGTSYEGPAADMRITTLGTGSAIPSKYRNVSAAMVECPHLLRDGQAGMILLDCGEGTLGQMRRMYGMQGMKRVYAELKMVFVSHMHADHHLGLQAILEDRFRHGLTSPLFILAPPQIGLALQENASWQSRDIASDEALNNVFFLNSARFLRSPVTPESLIWLDDAIDANGEVRMWPRSPKLSARPSRETLGAEPAEGPEGMTSATPNVVASVAVEARARSGSASEDEDPSFSVFASRRESAPKYVKGLLPHAAPKEWGQDDIARGTRRWPAEDVLGWSREINHRQGTYARSLLSTLNLSAIHCVQVPHRGYATALVLDHASGWRLVYSGDTKPSDKLARLGKDATVLIHEATIEDGLEATAEMKGHSTFGQAIDIGKRMGAKHILLNHFSQRYPKLPENLDLTGAPKPGAAGAEPVASAPGPSGDPGTAEPAVAESAGVQVTFESATETDISTDPVPPASDPATTLVPDLAPQVTAPQPIVAMSFDFMSVKIRDMYKVAHYLEPIAEFYKDGEDDNVASGPQRDAGAEGDAEEAAVNGTTNGSGGKGKKQAPTTGQGSKKQKGPKPPKHGKGPDGQTVGDKVQDRADVEQARLAKRPSEESGASPERKRAKEDEAAVETLLAPEQADL